MRKHVSSITQERPLPRMAGKMMHPEPTTCLGRALSELLCSVLELAFGFDYCRAVKTLA